MAIERSKIYTRTGDKGTTGLGDGRRVDKSNTRIEAIGCTDELNSLIGVLLANNVPESIHELLIKLQNQLLDLGAELAAPEHRQIDEEAVTGLERQLDRLDATLPPLRNFILPGGSPAAAACHHARTVCRRAERRVIGLSRQEEVSPHVLKFLNRLSDLLFVVARVLVQEEGVAEVIWHNPKKSS